MSKDLNQSRALQPLAALPIPLSSIKLNMHLLCSDAFVTEPKVQLAETPDAQVEETDAFREQALS